MVGEATQFEYKLKDVASLMVRDQGITEGHWMLMVRFAHGAVTIGADDGAAPAAINRVVSIGIALVDQPNPLSVDASEVSKAPQIT